MKQNKQKSLIFHRAIYCVADAIGSETRVKSGHP